MQHLGYTGEYGIYNKSIPPPGAHEHSAFSVQSGLECPEGGKIHGGSSFNREPMGQKGCFGWLAAD